MAKTNPFDKYPQEYDSWFDQHETIYRNELLAIRELMPDNPGRSIEIGVGGGRFSSELGISEGVEPSEEMAKIARSRGINVKIGKAENLPLKSSSYDLATLVTTICFVDDVDKAFFEAHRILRHGGEIIVAFIPKYSELGKIYRETKDQDKFFKIAKFYTTDSILDALNSVGFREIKAVQTITKGLEKADEELENPIKGYNKGSFVVLKGVKE